MSYLSDASLVMIPSGVEAGTVFTSKPAGGSADLTFTRSNDTATRVGPNGYIEKVRTNLILQSNSFDTTWTSVSSTETGGQTGYDGSSDAWLITKSGVSGRLDQTISASGVLTYSVYAKANALNWLRIVGTSTSAYFDLSNGVVGDTDAGNIAKITSVGNGWYRCEVAMSASTTIMRIYPADGNNDTSGTSGSIYIQDAQLEYGSVATDYIETTTAAVSVGPVANVPRINFDPVLPRTGSLLLEPQRTNTLAYSEYFGAWSLSGGTLTANATVSPQGVENAYLYTEDTSTNYHRINTGAAASSSNKVYSVYAKWAGGTANRWFTIDNGPTAWFDIVNGVTGSTQGSVVTSIEDCGNGWYRCIYYNPASTTGGIYLGIASSNGGAGNHTGNGQPTFYIYGAQCEDNVTYPTSYIPTYSAAVTRGADACSKTGISSVIGQTEGTLFVEAKVTLNGRFLLIGTTGNFIEILIKSTGKVNAFVYNGSTQVDILSTSTYATGDTLKIALAYKQNDFALYVNGTAEGTDTSGNIPTGMAQLIVNDYTVAGYNSANAYSQALLFQTRLTNDQLSQITTL